MTSSRFRAFSVGALLLIGSAATHATTLSYTATNLAGNEWRYDYSIANDTLSPSLSEFTVYFDLALYQNLTSPAQPAGWNSIIAQPDPALPDAGFFDSAADDLVGLLAGSSLSGFSVDFTWLGADAPGAQSFDVIDASTFARLDSGRTVPAQVASVPEPGSMSMFLVALGMTALTAIFRRRRRVALPQEPCT